MKYSSSSRPGVLLATGLGVGLLISGASELIFEPEMLRAQAQQTLQPNGPEASQPQTETTPRKRISRLLSLLPRSFYFSHGPAQRY